MEKQQWFRPALWFTLTFNILACVPTLLLLRLPAGSEQLSDDTELTPFVTAFFCAAMVFLIGFPRAHWRWSCCPSSSERNHFIQSHNP